MKQSTTLKDCQTQLLEVIGRINRNSEDVKNALEGKTDVILLVGDTGSGKSTVFNLLCGAEFQLDQEGIKQVLKIKKGTKNYSEMKHGTKSVTTEPKYHYVDEIQHLIIDFPGFRDTRGEIEELVIQLLFNKIVTKNKVKLVYLIQQPLLSLPNRGTFVQEFMKIFKNQKFRFSECILLLNSFALEDTSENNLIQNVLEELKSITKDPEQKNQKICVIRNLNQQRLPTIPQIRKNILQEISSSKPIRFTPFEIKNVDIISKYLLRTSKVLSESIYQSLNGEIQVAIMTSDNETSVKLQVVLKSLASIKDDKVSSQYQRVFTIYEELTSGLRVRKHIDVEQNASFFKIYHYFEEFKDFIDGYQDCAGNLEKIYDLAQLLYKQIEFKLSQSNLQKEQVKQLKQQQAEFQEQYKQMQQQMIQQMEQVRKEEKQMREEQLQQIRQANELQLKQLQSQIEKQQNQGGGGIFEKIIQVAAVALPIALKFI